MQREITSLTSIRGIAALIVVWYHVAASYTTYELPLLSWTSQGALAVDLFFILSGFILAYVYSDIRIQHFSSFYTTFIKARLTRIYPLHLASLLVLAALVFTFPDIKERYSDGYFELKAFVLNLLLVQNWGFIDMSWNLVSWSISAEWFMYLLFPIMLIAQRKILGTKLWSILSAIALTLFAHYSFIVIFNLDGYGGVSLGGMIRVFFEFCFGFLLFFIRRNLDKKQNMLIGKTYYFGRAS